MAEAASGETLRRRNRPAHDSADDEAFGTISMLPDSPRDTLAGSVADGSEFSSYARIKYVGKFQSCMV